MGINDEHSLGEDKKTNYEIDGEYGTEIIY